MPDHFRAALNRVRELNRQFKAGESSYNDPSYPESQARLDFIDKFWSALGWDVAHEHQKNPYKQEVKVEKSHAFEGRRQHADYTFLAPNFHDVLFFVEAKKPSIDLDTPNNYFQVVRYGWPNAVPISVLTDFQRFRVIDCRFKPDIDSALDRGISELNFHYSDFDSEEAFAKVYWLFSREAVAGGSLDEYAKNMPRPRGGARQRRLFPVDTAPFDEDFLSAIEGFRRDLARAIKKHNSRLSSQALTEIVQRILDRLIFMRFLEDKLIEPEPIVRLLGTSSDSAWNDFVAQCRRLDRIYNGIIFKRHPTIDDPSFTMDPHVFEAIRDDLSNDESPYSFEQIPIHILGSIYERFLGSTVVVTETSAEVVQKPEVRRAGGVYYTPEYIVREIVDLSVGRQIEGRSPDDLEHYRACDLACGSGSFLLGLYDRLLRHYTAFYNQPENRRLATRRGLIKHEDGSLHLPLLVRREILLRHVYGVDIDPQAVEVAQLSLYLKLLEEETTASARQNQLTLREALLPSLTDNIKCGNALVEWDGDSESISTEDQRALSPMTFSHEFRVAMRAGGFDAIIGNPPYDVLEKDRDKASWPHDLLHVYVRQKREYAPALGGKLNLFRFFVIRAMTLVRQGGRVGMIVPLSLLADVSCGQTRRFMLTTSHGLQAKCFPQKDDRNRRVFKDAKLSTMIFATEKRPPSRSMDTVSISVYPGKSLTDSPKRVRVRPADAELLDRKNLPLPLVDGRDWDLCVRIHRMESVVRLGEMSDFIVRRGEVNQTTLSEFISETDTGTRLLKGTEVARYFERASLSQGEREWFREGAFLEGHNAWTETSARRIALQRITGIDERYRLVGTIIEPPCYFADSTNSIMMAADATHSLEYLLCLLNSSLFQWRFKVSSTNNNVATNEIDSLPFRLIDFDNAAERRTYALIVRKVSELSSLRENSDKSLSERDSAFNTRRANVLDEQLDEMVAELYGLTKDEALYMSQLVARAERSRTF